MAKKIIDGNSVEAPKDVSITKKQKGELDVAANKIVEVKMRISDLTEQLIVAQRQVEAGEQQRYGLFDEKYAAESEYRVLLENTARLNGIDPAATDAKYEFNGERFLRVAVEATEPQ
jgi:hypothetical protein